MTCMIERLIDNGILYVLGLFLMYGLRGWEQPVVVVLLGLLYIALSDCVQKETGRLLVMGAFVLLSFWVQPFLFFFSLLVYDCVRMRSWKSAIITFVGACNMVHICVIGNMIDYQILLWIFSLVVAFVFAVRTERSIKQAGEVIHLKDSSTELRLIMQKRQQDLMEKQDYEIHLATLQERNRIAREIHDNVGHMLSRSILQIGALQTIHKEEPLNGQLVQINETLNQAMNNIRESVHDLHNESLDLHQALKELVGQFEEQYEIQLTYDMSAGIPRNVKYCFLAIAKEALANVVRHSNANRITLYFCEHPGFFQMFVEDNGTNISLNKIHEGGIGLANMRDRVEALGGTISFLTENGFGIRISIPKQNSK